MMGDAQSRKISLAIEMISAARQNSSRSNAQRPSRLLVQVLSALSWLNARDKQMLSDSRENELGCGSVMSGINNLWRMIRVA